MIRLVGNFEVKAETAGNALFSIQTSDFSALFQLIVGAPLARGAVVAAIPG
jgi:hypothetical protein